MITLELTNRHVTVRDAPRSVIRALDRATSYKVEGARYVKAFKQGHWDGREHLLKISVKHGMRVPIGLAEDIAGTLKAEGQKFAVVDRRVVHGKRRRLEWNPEHVPRPYQREAIRALLKDTSGRLLFGCGLLKSPIRSGKTMMAAMYIHALGLRTLVIVPSQMLLHQTVESLSARLPSEKIGVIGDGQSDIQFITVATMQSLGRWRGRDGAKPNPRWDDIAKNTDVVIIDEAHRIRGDTELKSVASSINARFRLALSATPYLDSEVEQGRGIIWLKATNGPLRIDIGESRLIQEGFLMAQNIKMHHLTKPLKFKDWRWSVTLQREAIWLNQERNKRIVDEAKAYVKRGIRTLIVTSRVEHTSELCEMLWSERVRHEAITGSHGREHRIDAMDNFVNGKLRLLVGTVLSEGVDIPEAEVVIIAAGGRDAKATMQRMRNMTISEGKTQALLVDFVDDFNPYLKKHSMERLKVYKSVPEFNVEIVG